MQFISLRSAGQMTMPDHVCTGQTRHYFVNPGTVTGSTYTWWIDRNIVPGINTSEFIFTWNSPKTYLLEVQEISSDGCPGPRLSGLVLVNPQPEIQVIAADSQIFNGESVTLSVQNPSGLIWGKWIFDLIVEPDSGITGNIINGTFTSPYDLHETLFNNDTAVHKVVYRFKPGILSDDGVQACEGKEVKITVWIYPGFRFKEASLVIPDAFSPNGDGINDVWNIKGIDLYPTARITICNRWGQVLWKSERGYPVPWDGVSRGKALPVDSYYYFIELRGRPRLIVGTVTIVR